MFLLKPEPLSKALSRQEIWGKGPEEIGMFQQEVESWYEKIY